MKFAAILSALACLGNAAVLQKATGDAIEGQYIVVMKPNKGVGALRSLASTCFTNDVWENLNEFKGFGARLNSDELHEILLNEDVEYVEPDQKVYAIGSFRQDACSATQTGSQSWGQSRTTRVSGTGNYEHEPSWGTGVKVYIIDTGSNCNHEDFNSKCSCGPTYQGGSNGCSDGHGHGSHCASTATGSVWGIAKNAEMVGVKVLGDNGSGSTSGVISGMNWVASQGSGSVASMSLGGGYSSSSNAAVKGMNDAGVFVAVAAGNDNRDACNYSPASAPEAYTAGSTTSSDSRSSFSNIGTCVDIFAPGSSITAASNTPGRTATMSGTSMACPHVAGAAAALRSENPSASVSQIKSMMTNLGLSGAVGNPGSNSPNLLLHLEC